MSIALSLRAPTSPRLPRRRKIDEVCMVLLTYLLQLAYCRRGSKFSSMTSGREPASVFRANSCSAAPLTMTKERRRNHCQMNVRRQGSKLKRQPRARPTSSEPEGERGYVLKRCELKPASPGASPAESCSQRREDGTEDQALLRALLAPCSAEAACLLRATLPLQSDWQ